MALKIFLTVLILGLVLTPLMQLMPTKRQKRLSGLRQRAVQAGWLIKWVAKPELGTEAGKNARKVANAFIYHLSRQVSDSAAPTKSWPIFNFGRSRQNAGEWFCFYGKRPPALLLEQVNEQLRQLPLSVDVLESNAAGLGVFWDEADEQELAGIKQCLMAIDKLEQAYWQKNNVLESGD